MRYAPGTCGQGRNSPRRGRSPRIFLFPGVRLRRPTISCCQRAISFRAGTADFMSPKWNIWKERGRLCPGSLNRENGTGRMRRHPAGRSRNTGMERMRPARGRRGKIGTALIFLPAGLICRSFPMRPGSGSQGTIWWMPIRRCLRSESRRGTAPSGRRSRIISTPPAACSAIRTIW